MIASNEPIFWDTETCGFYGMPVLLQYAVGESDPKIQDLWYQPANESLEIIEWMLHHEGGNVLFNAAFDLFHIIKFHTTVTQCYKVGLEKDFIPLDYVDVMGVCEEQARMASYTLKWKKLVDLMIVAQQGPYQSMMNRKGIRIRRIPTILAPHVATYLGDAIPMSDALFAKFKDKRRRWVVREDEDDPDFCDVACDFAPSSGLKVIAMDAGMIVEQSFDDIQYDEKPVEYGWAPFAKAGVVSDGYILPTGPGKWRGTWPDRIYDHAGTWRYNERARKYAYDDPILTRGVYKHLGCPAMNDVNSVLTNLVSSCRWRGFAINKEQMGKAKEEAVAVKMSAPRAPNLVKEYVYQDLEEAERMVIDDMGGGTGKQILEKVAKWDNKAGERAREVVRARAAQKEVELYDKLLHAGRFHASFKVLGTLSDRMAGSDGLNAQGIKASKTVRAAFPLRDKEMILCGGDFDAFEISIAAAVYDDPKLTEALTEGLECPECFGLLDECDFCKGTGKIMVKIHTLFAQALYPNLTLKEIEDSKGTENDYYLDGKRGVFAMLYGGDENTLQDRIGIDEETAQAAFQRFEKMFPGVKRFRDTITSKFCSMTQPGGIGTRVIWKDPAEYIESIFGFRRYFTLENQICKALFELAESPPKSWRDVRVKVMRRDREQTACGSVQSALFGAAFGVQGKCLRAAANHLIQSPGADITKNVQTTLWELQPVGAQPWHVMCFNVHDEVNGLFANAELLPLASERIHNTVNHFKEQVPLLAIDWNENLQSWADKK